MRAGPNSQLYPSAGDSTSLAYWTAQVSRPVVFLQQFKPLVRQISYGLED